jgi:hypothetical protein
VRALEFRHRKTVLKSRLMLSMCRSCKCTRTTWRRVTGDVERVAVPKPAVYAAIDHPGLRQITCGGTYDAARHRYVDNVIVFATLKAVHGP